MVNERKELLSEDIMLNEFSTMAEKCSYINPELYTKYDVKRGLRDINGRGVLAGLTEIGEVHAYIIDESDMIPIPGRLMYRGIDVKDLVNGFLTEDRFGFEETCYLLLFGRLPNRKELDDFDKMLS